MLQIFDDRNRDLIVNINGQLTHRDEARISPFDSAVQGGDAVWEGLRLYDGRIFKLYEHLDRLERSARALSFAKIPSREVLDARIHHANLLNSILAKIEANQVGADDALMLDTRGFVAETNATHVFIVRNGDLATSRVVACPEGITRSTVIEICAADKIRCVETDLSVVDIYGGNEMFCTGTMGELAAVTKIDNRQIGDGKVGAMTKRLSDLYTHRTASEGVQVV